MDYASGPYSVTFPARVMSAPFNVPVIDDDSFFTFTATAISVPFNIPINDDNISEGSENFTLTINSSLPNGVMIGNSGQATVTIVDNDRKFWLNFPLSISYFLSHINTTLYIVDWVELTLLAMYKVHMCYVQIIAENRLSSLMYINIHSYVWMDLGVYERMRNLV